MNRLKLTKKEQQTWLFLQAFLEKNETLPTHEQVKNSLGISFSTAENHLKKLSRNGLIKKKLSQKNFGKEWREKQNIVQMDNKPVRTVIEAVRSGVHELSREQIEKKAYPVNVMTTTLSDGMIWTFLFTVNRRRGYEEYERIQKQNKKTSHSRYGSSLFYGMFKNW